MAISSAEAGPSSAARHAEPDASSDLQSMRQLYYALESSGYPVPRSTLQSKIQQVVPLLRTSYESPKPSSPASISKIEGNGVRGSNGQPIELDKSLQAIVKQCASLHDLDEADVALCLRMYLDSDEATLDQLLGDGDETAVASIAGSQLTKSKRGRKSMARSHRKDNVADDLVDALCVFYFEERLYALKCVSALLRIGDDQLHDLNGVAETALRQFIDTGFALKCLHQMEALCSQPLSDRIREIPRYSTYRSKHALQIQLALLEIVFMIFYSRLESTASFVDAIHQIANSTDFGRRQVNAGFYDNTASAMLECVANSVLLLCVESLDVERIIDGTNMYASRTSSDAEAGADTQLIETPNIVGRTVDFLKTSTVRDTLRGPLLLVWALFLCRFDSAVSDWREARQGEDLPRHLQSLLSVLDGRGGASQLWTDLVSAAFIPEIDLFPTLRSVARSPLISCMAGSKVSITFPLSYSLALRAVLKGVVLSISELVRPEYIQDYDGLVDIWQHTFVNEEAGKAKVIGAGSDSAAALCAQFWQSDYEHERRRSVLATAARRFPVSFLPLVRLCQALSGSGPSSLHATDEAWQASRSVLEYLASLQTITMVMPQMPSVSAPFEAQSLQEGDASHDYRATRSIPVFGRHLVVPKGTSGDVVSAEGKTPIVMVWHVGELADQDEGEGSIYSAWLLMRDVLARFAGLLDRREAFQLSPRPKDGDGDASVFAENIVSASFASLAPGESGAFDGDVAAEIMDLFSSILATDSNLGTLLLAHLRAERATSAAQPTAWENSKLDLGMITIAILNQALVAPESASKVIISAYRLLTQWTPTLPDGDIWAELRSSGLLIGSTGMSPLTVMPSLSRPSTTRSLLVHETDIGRYAGLLSMLNFHHALLVDLQQSSLYLTAANTELRTDVLLRVLRFVAEQVWLAYQDWKYVQVQQRIEIGIKCISIFSSILRDTTLVGTAGTLRNMAMDMFLSGPTSTAFVSPLLRVLASGLFFIRGLQRAGRPVEVELAKEMVEKSLGFARLIVESNRRRHGTATISRIELSFIDRSSTKNVQASLAGTIMNCINSPLLTSEARVEAIKLFTSVSSATRERHQDTALPAIMSHLGSISDVEGVLKGVIKSIQSEEEGADVRASLLNLLAALVDGQPGMATLLLTGKHITFAQNEVKTDKALSTTALHVACEIVQRVKARGWAAYIEPSDLIVLDATLKFLTAAWRFAVEHRAEYDEIRESKAFWDAVLEIAAGGMDQGICSTSPSQLEVLSTGACVSDADDAVITSALKKVCATSALLLITDDVRIASALTTAAHKTRADQNTALSLQGVIAWLKDEKKLVNVTTTAVGVQCDPLRHLDVLARMEESFPELQLDDYRNPARVDQFDSEKRYGCSYVYDLQALRFKLHGLARVAASQSSGEEAGLDEDAITQATLLVAGINLEWSVIDSQSIYLRAWSTLLSAVIGPLYDRMVQDAGLRQSVQRCAGTAWVACALASAEEQFATSMVKDIHGLRLSFLAVLLEIATHWALEPTPADAKATLSDAEKTLALDIMHQAVRLITHPLHSIEDAMKQAPLGHDVALHRDAGRVLMACAHLYRACRRTLKDGQEAELSRSLTRHADTLLSYTVTYLRIGLDRCILFLNAPGSSSDQENGRTYTYLDLDLRLLATSLTLLLHESAGLTAQNWLPKILTAEVLPAAMELFSRSPLTTAATTESLTDEGSNSGVVPCFWEVLLDLFLAFASQVSTAETLILAGVMNALGNNALAMHIDSIQGSGGGGGSTYPLESLGGTAKRDLHLQWIKILRVVESLTTVLQPAQQRQFVTGESLSFFGVYLSLLQSSLGRPLLDAVVPVRRLQQKNDASGEPHAPAHGKSDVSDTVLLRPFQELKMVTGLYAHCLRAFYVAGGDGDESDGQHNRHGTVIRRFVQGLVDHFVRHATVRLQEAVHLLQHPQELAAQLGLDDDGGRLKREYVHRTEAWAKRYLVQAGVNIVATLWHLSGGAQILCTASAESVTEWSLEDIVIVPTIGTSPTQASSIGTLLDLSSFVGDSLRSSAPDKEEKEALVAALEHTLSLTTTQLTLSLHGNQQQKTAAGRRSLALSAGIQTIDVEAGLGRDVSQATESAKVIVREYYGGGRSEGEGKGEKRRMAYLDLLSTFQKRWLLTNE